MPDVTPPSVAARPASPTATTRAVGAAATLLGLLCFVWTPLAVWWAWPPEPTDPHPWMRLGAALLVGLVSALVGTPNVCVGLLLLTGPFGRGRVLGLAVATMAATGVLGAAAAAYVTGV